MIELNTPKIGIAGYIGIRVVTAEGKERWTNIDPETGLGPKNLIVDSGLNLLGTLSPSGASDYCRVGTGTTTPAVGQTDLVSRYGSGNASITASSSSNSGAAPWWHQYERDYQFSAGTIDGAALTEVGFFSSSSGAMFSRNLIKDGGGTPTSITLTSTEILYITYNLRVEVPNADATGTFQINSENYNYTARAANASSSTAWGLTSNFFTINQIRARETQTLGAITSVPAGSGDGGSSTQDAYVNLSNESTAGTSFSDSQGNFTLGIGSFTFGSSSSYPKFQVSVDKVSDGSRIAKDNTKTLTMNSAFKIAWDRV